MVTIIYSSKEVTEEKAIDLADKAMSRHVKMSIKERVNILTEICKVELTKAQKIAAAIAGE